MFTGIYVIEFVGIPKLVVRIGSSGYEASVGWVGDLAIRPALSLTNTFSTRQSAAPLIESVGEGRARYLRRIECMIHFGSIRPLIRSVHTVASKYMYRPTDLRSDLIPSDPSNDMDIGHCISDSQPKNRFFFFCLKS